MSATLTLHTSSNCERELSPSQLLPLSAENDPLQSRPSVLTVHGAQQRLTQKLEAHRRWNTSMPLGFLSSIDRIEIHHTRSNATDSLVYVLEVFLSLPASRLPTSQLKASTGVHCSQNRPSRPTFVVERQFSDFEELREEVLGCVTTMPQCTCQYCTDFLVYIRYKLHQPRGIVKLMTKSPSKRKAILETFINEFVAMGQRRAEKPGKKNRKCAAQAAVPEVLAHFLLSGGAC